MLGTNKYQYTNSYLSIEINLFKKIKNHQNIKIIFKS